MALLEPLVIENRSASCSTRLLRSTACGFAHNDAGMACVAKSTFASPRYVSSVNLLPAPCAAYQNGQIIPVSIVKADKTPFPPPLPNVWALSPENTSRLASLPRTLPDEGPSTWYGSTLQSPQELLRWQRQHPQHHKPLLSPIKFDHGVESRSTNQCELPHPDYFDIEDHLVFDDKNSFNSSDWELAVPSRRLSYGEPLNLKEASQVRRAGSAEFSSKTKVLAKDQKCDLWIDETLKAQATRPYNSEPSRSKPRLWLDLVADDEEITEAYATAVTTSPSKPRMISIGPRRTDVEQPHNESGSPTKSLFQPGMSTLLPETPPRSPIPSMDSPQCLLSPATDILMKTAVPTKQGHQHFAFNRIRSRTRWSISTPTRADTALWSSETVRQEIPPSPRVRPPPAIQRQATPPPMPMTLDIKLSELTTWIITELENATNSTHQPLHLDHPVIRQLRLPPKQRKASRLHPLVPALSNFSVMPAAAQSLDNNASSSSDPAASHPPKARTWPSASPSSPSLPAPDATLSILSRVFPLAPLSTLSTLLAAILAHDFVSTLHLPFYQQQQQSHSSSPTSPFTTRHNTSHHPTSLPPTTTAIPTKARAMLGLPPLSSPTKPTRERRPPLPSFWRKVEKLEWEERVGVLEGRLRGVVGGLVRELVEVGGEEWRSGQRWLDLLVSALGEAVRLGEATKVGEESWEGGRLILGL